MKNLTFYSVMILVCMFLSANLASPKMLSAADVQLMQNSPLALQKGKPDKGLPGEIPDIICWFDAWSLPVGDISVWKDKSGNGYHAIHDELDKPESFEDDHFLYFLNTSMAVDFNGNTYDNPYTIVFAIQIDQQHNVMDGLTYRDYSENFTIRPSTRIRMLNFGTDLLMTDINWDHRISTQFTLSEVMIVTYIFDGENNAIRINGETKAAGGFTDGHIPGFRLGSQWDLGNPFNGKIGELLIYNGRVDSLNIDILEDYLETKWIYREWEEPKIELSINIHPTDAGTVSGAGNFAAQDSVLLTATSNEGYIFVNWVDADNVDLGTEESISYVIPGSDVVLTANFQPTTVVPEIMNHIRFYPNPAGTYLCVENLNGQNQINITNITGQQVRQLNSNLSKIRINLDELQTGVYMIQIINENGYSKTSKFIKR